MSLGARDTAVRNGTIDILRFLGACGIVVFHLRMDFGWLALSALPMFVMLVFHYGARQPLRRAAHRLLVPWAIWCILYALLKIAQALLAHRPVAMEFEGWMVLTGPAIHLWFLPFCFLFLAAYKVLDAIVPQPVLFPLGLLLSLACIWASNHIELPIPLLQWFSVIPAAFLGVLTHHRADPLTPLAGFIAACTVLILLGWSQVTWQLVIGAAAVLVGLALPTAPTRLSQRAAGVSLGVYLVHPVVVSLLLYATPRPDAIFCAAVISASILLTLAIRSVMPKAV